MALKYFQAENYGKGFITHEDNEFKHVSGYPGNIWVTENEVWAQRVGATELTKEQAQAIVDAEIAQVEVNPPNQQGPVAITLP